MSDFKPAAQWQYDERLSLKQKNFLNCLQSALCIVLTAIKLMHKWEEETGSETRMSRRSHGVWLENDDIYKMYYLDLRTDVKDFGESKLHELMNGYKHRKETRRYTKEGDFITEVEEWTTPPDRAAVIFFNKTQNKDRGYVERQELTTPEGIQIQMMAPIILEVNKPIDITHLQIDETS